MIYVGEIPFSADDSSSSNQDSDILITLMEHPVLLSASQSLKAIPVRKFSTLKEPGSGRLGQSKCVYIFQREYATVDPALVDFVGTDESTTCVGLVIRNRHTGMTSVAHMDSPNIVDAGLNQMLSLVTNHHFDAILDVHLIGAFVDSLPQQAISGTESPSYATSDVYSFPLCAKIIQALAKRKEKFHIQTLHVLQHNTRWDSVGNACPVFDGLLVETSTGSVIAASFDGTSRCPDEIVRRIRVTSCLEDPTWTCRLLETYETQTDRFIISPCSWTIRQLHIAMTLQHYSDAELLLTCSTSPSAEAPDFVDNLRRQFKYLIQHPDCQETFPSGQPRIFVRSATGGWIRN